MTVGELWEIRIQVEKEIWREEYKEWIQRRLKWIERKEWWRIKWREIEKLSRREKGRRKWWKKEKRDSDGPIVDSPEKIQFSVSSFFDQTRRKLDCDTHQFLCHSLAHQVNTIAGSFSDWSNWLSIQETNSLVHDLGFKSTQRESAMAALILTLIHTIYKLFCLQNSISFHDLEVYYYF